MTSEAKADSGVKSSSSLRIGRLLRGTPIYPLLLAAYPVLLLYSGNITEVPVSDMLTVLATVLVGTAVGLVVLSMLFRSTGRAALVVAAVVASSLLFGYLQDAVSFLGRSDWVPLVAVGLVPAWAVAVVIITYLAHRVRARLPRITEALNVSSVVLVALVLAPILTSSHFVDVHGESDGGNAVTTIDTSRAGRDIYHLVFDRYGSRPSLEAANGLSNAAFLAWLDEAGFQVIDDARANYVRTAESLASTFSMSLLDELAATMGSSNPDPTPIYERLARSPAAALLQSLGYRYFHVGSWWQWTSRSAIADHSPQPRFQASFASTVVDNSILPWLDVVVGIGLGVTASVEDRWAETTQHQFDDVALLMAEAGPKFVFAHFLVPHPPYVFLEDGTIAPDRATFETQLAFTNARVQQLLEPLLALPVDQRPIIILQADEGPRPPRYEADLQGFDWSAATDSELIAKFGILNAMYLPGPEGEAPLPNGLSAVNTYPEVLGRYFDVVVPRSPDRSYVSPPHLPYDQTDISDRLNDAMRRWMARPGQSGD